MSQAQPAPQTEPCINISGYKFTPLSDLPELRETLLTTLRETGVLGTILLAREGINIALAGPRDSIDAASRYLISDPRFGDLWLKESVSDFTPFSKLKVRIRDEIIAFDKGRTQPDELSAPLLPPQQLKSWLDQGKPVLLLDTRNTYEFESGTFENATTLPIRTFREFSAAVSELGEDIRQQPIVTFCTGGVRCEKAAPWMAANGFSEVYQIEGGILNYFEQCGGAHWEGNCFIFDDRVEIDPGLQATGAVLCHGCHRAVSVEQQSDPAFEPDQRCPNCAGAEQQTTA